VSTFVRLLGFLRPYRAGAVWSLVLAALAMVGALVTHDFTILYVAENGS
jgi:cytochrome c biogenesis factor